MTPSLPRRVTIVEVGPRDGLQNEAGVVPTAAKIAFVNGLSAAGHSVIEVSAFVSPKWVPKMADASDVFAGITRQEGVRYTALVPNLAGLARAHAAGVREIAIFAAASETFSKRNINQTIDESLATYRSVVDEAPRCGTPTPDAPASSAARRRRTTIATFRSPTSRPSSCIRPTSRRFGRGSLSFPPSASAASSRR